MRPALIGDIGGTNARLALVTPGEVTPHDILNLPCADYPGVIEAIQDYLARVGATGDNAPQEACLAFACPVHAERVKMTNNHWDFMKSDVQQALNLSLFKVINDFTAQALGVPHVGEDNLVEVQPGEAQSHSTRLVIGPGTGLSVATVSPSSSADGSDGPILFTARTETRAMVVSHGRPRILYLSSGGGGGQVVTHDDTRRKLELVLEVADEVWG